MKAGQLLRIIDDLKARRKGDTTSVADGAGLNRSYLSRFLNGDPEKALTPQMERKLKAVFPEFFASDKSNVSRETKTTTTAQGSSGTVVLSEEFLEILRQNKAILEKITKIGEDTIQAHKDIAEANLIAQKVNLKLASAVEAQILRSPVSAMDVSEQKKQDFLSIGAELDKDLDAEVAKRKGKPDGSPRIGDQKKKDSHGTV